MNKFLKYACIVLLIISCKKFDHNQLPKNECSLCNYAQELEGEYRGYNYSVNSIYNDSVTAYIEQFFLGNNQFEDSTVMYFQLAVVFDNSSGSQSTTTFIDTIRIINTTGETMDFEPYNLSIGACIDHIDPNIIKLDGVLKYFNTTVQWYWATLYRQ